MILSWLWGAGDVEGSERGTASDRAVNMSEVMSAAAEDLAPLWEEQCLCWPTA